MFKEWFEVFFKPESTKEYEGGFGQGLLNVFVASLIAGVIIGMIVAFFGSVFGGMLKPIIGTAVGIGSFFLVLIYIVISGILGLILGSAILLLFAKIFGGKGSYSEQTYRVSLISSVLILISGIIGWIPIVNLISAIAGIYSLYPLTIVLRETHKYSTGKAVLTWLIPLIIILVIGSIISLIAGILFTGALRAAIR